MPQRCLVLRIHYHYPGPGNQNSDLSLAEDKSVLRTSRTHTLPEPAQEHPREVQGKGRGV